MEKSDDSLLKPVTERYPDHQWLVKGAFVTAVAVGTGGAISAIWKTFYDSWKDSPLVSDLKKDREKATETLALKAKSSPMSRVDFIANKKTIEDAWSTGFNKRLKNHLGIESEGLGMVKGTWQRFNSLGDYTRSKIIFSAVLSTAAAIGGYMLINQNAAMKRDQHRLQDQLSDDRRANQPPSTER
jgi:hypothetical protein